MNRHPVPGALLIGLVFGVLFALLIGAADTHGWRFAFTAGLAIGLLLLAPYVWRQLRRQ